MIACNHRARGNGLLQDGGIRVRPHTSVLPARPRPGQLPEEHLTAKMLPIRFSATVPRPSRPRAHRHVADKGGLRPAASRSSGERCETEKSGPFPLAKLPVGQSGALCQRVTHVDHLDRAGVQQVVLFWTVPLASRSGSNLQGRCQNLTRRCNTHLTESAAL